MYNNPLLLFASEKGFYLTHRMSIIRVTQPNGMADTISLPANLLYYKTPLSNQLTNRANKAWHSVVVGSAFPDKFAIGIPTQR